MDTYEIHAFTVTLYETLTIQLKIKNNDGDYVDEKFIKAKYDPGTTIEEQVTKAVESAKSK